MKNPLTITGHTALDSSFHRNQLLKTVAFRCVIVAVVLFISQQYCTAQKSSDNWYFGNNAALNFSSGTPVAVTGSAMTTTEGCISASDNAGHLMFYSDGITMYNKNNMAMPNGTFMLGDPSSTQSALAVANPANANQYYIFTLSAYPNSNLTYSIVDMSLDGGLGDVIDKNTLVLSGTNENIVAVKVGTFYWIVTHKQTSNQFYNYKLDTSGLSAAPVISSVGSTTNLDGELGYMKCNGAGTKIVSCNYFANNAELFDFDKSTGLLSNAIMFTANGAYGAEFSPAGQLLYISGVGFSIDQYNIEAGTAADVVASKVVISGDDTWGSLQLANNGKIYVANYSKSSLSVINNPDSAGSACNFLIDTVSLGAAQSQFGLPTFVVGDVLITLPVQLSSFSAQPGNGFVHIQWKTASEENTAYYSIERSSNINSVFDQISKITARNLRSAQTYNSVDEKPLMGTSYYRLRSTDADGKSTLSKVVPVLITATSTVSISPNPIADAAKIYINSTAAGQLTLQVIDMAGKIIFNQQKQISVGTNSVTLPGDFSKGMYILKVIQNGKEQSLKFVK